MSASAARAISSSVECVAGSPRVAAPAASTTSRTEPAPRPMKPSTDKSMTACDTVRRLGVASSRM